MRTRGLIVAAIAAVALSVRLYPAWDGVFGSDGVNFLETDAWYHVRLAENQVRNYPWRVTLDPYAASGGQFVPIAPLYDTITSTVVVVLYGRGADTDTIERVAAFIPPLLGTLAVITLWVLARRLFDRRAALLSAALLAILPGHFMDRTMLGFVDHHALEALLAMATLVAIVRAIDRTSLVAAAEVGGVLGLYLLGWASGAFLIGIVGVWLVLLVPLVRSAEPLAGTGRTIAVAALVALLLVALFQDPRMHRYGSQVAGLLGLAAIALAVTVFARGHRDVLRPWLALVAVAAVVAVTGAMIWGVRPGLFSQVLTDLRRFAPDPTRMGVLEARPLFLYPGEWNWWQPWQFFRTGFYIGLVALIPFTVRVWRDRRPADLLVWLFGVTTFAATIGQNRFGYYLVPACALLGGWLAAAILDWSEATTADGAAAARLRIPFRRELAALVVAGVMFAPNLAPAVLLMPRSGSLAAYWQSTMTWLRRETPPPFRTSAPAGDEFYLARYPRDSVPSADYTVMNWWDQGYWLMQRGRRVPVANPTQERARNAARFYAETEESRAGAILAQERSRFVLSDWELPFRVTPEHRVMGRFQNVLEWAGATHAEYYEICYRRERNAWNPVWVFHEPYYRSMAYRLAVLGGAAAEPANSTTLLTLVERTDQQGMRFREILTQRTYPTYQAARRAAAATAAQTMVVGLDPWRSAFPLDAITSLVQVYAARTPDQETTEAPWVRVFEVR